MRALQLKEKTDFLRSVVPLEAVDIPRPIAEKKEILVKVAVCGICHTELDEIEGRMPPTKFPIILGHQILGRVEELGAGCKKFKVGERVGISWIHSACGVCQFCRSGRENLCGEFQATGRDVDGGYAEFTTVSEDYAFRIPDVFADAEAAPLLCAGAIGYRSLKLANVQDGENIGLTGFGASGHLVLKIAQYQYPHSKVFVFSRTGSEQQFARELGAYWAGCGEDKVSTKLHAIIDTTPAWKPVIEALGQLENGGRLVINAIRKEEGDKKILSDLNYQRDLWMEKEIKSVANITRKDVEDFLVLAAAIPIRPDIQEYWFDDVNLALRDLKERRIRGAKVLRITK